MTLDLNSNCLLSKQANIISLESQLAQNPSQEVTGRKSTKYCSKCKQYRPVNEFHKYNGSYTGLQPYCKPCGKSYNAQLKAAKKNAPPKTDCCVCGANKNDHKIRLDHDHETGVFRGWLCHRCNLALGMMDDSVEKLLSAVKYLSTTV